jgi:ABC-type transporter Mla MlaB component
MYDKVKEEGTYLVGSRSSKIKDRIDCFNADVFSEKGNEYISETPVNNPCCFDFSDIKAADISWAAVMIDFYKRCKQENRRMKVSGICEKLTNVLDMSKTKTLIIPS